MYCTSNRSSWLEQGSVPVSCGVNLMTFGFLNTSQSTFSVLILALCRQNCTFFKNDRKTQSFGAFWLLSLWYKYLLRDMMNYHCLRVVTSRVRRIEKHSPGFSVFRTRVHGCSYAEPCRVPIQSTVGRFFFPVKVHSKITCRSTKVAVNIKTDYIHN